MERLSSGQQSKDTLNIRFQEGWVMLRRSFKFAELDYEIPKLSLVYVYSERPILKMKIKEEYWKRLKIYENRNSSLPSFLQDDDIEKQHPPEKEEQYEEYQGEIVQTLFSGNLTKFYPEEYKSTDLKKYSSLDDFHACYELKKNDEMYLKQEAIVNQVHYLMSRGMNREMAELYVSSSAKHSVWYHPTEQLQQIFEGLEPLRRLT